MPESSCGWAIGFDLFEPLQTASVRAEYMIQ